MSQKPLDKRTINEIQWKVSKALFELTMKEHNVFQIEGISEASQAFKKVLDSMMRKAE